MKITKTKTYSTDDGKIHASIEDAQRHALAVIFGNLQQDPTAFAVAEFVHDHSDAIRACLPKSPRKPRAPKVAPAKPAKAKKVEVIA